MYRNLPLRLLTSSTRVVFTEAIFTACDKYTCAIMTKNMAPTRSPCTHFSDPWGVFVSKSSLTFVLSENGRRYLFLSP